MAGAPYITMARAHRKCDLIYLEAPRFRIQQLFFLPLPGLRRRTGTLPAPYLHLPAVCLSIYILTYIPGLYKVYVR